MKLYILIGIIPILLLYLNIRFKINWRANYWWRNKGCYYFKTCPSCLTPRTNHDLCKKCKEEILSNNSSLN